MSHEGLRFACGGTDCQVIIWLVSKLKGFLKYRHNNTVKKIVWHPYQVKLISLSDSDFAIWCRESGMQKFEVRNLFGDMII